MALRPVCAWARGVGFGYFAGMVSVNKWSIYFHTPWGVHDHLRSLRTCAFTPLAAIVSQSHQPFKGKKYCDTPKPKLADGASPLVASTLHAISTRVLDMSIRTSLGVGAVKHNSPGRSPLPPPGRSPLPPPPQGGFGKFHYEWPVRTMSQGMSCRFDSRGRSHCCPRPPLGFVKRPPFKFRALIPK